MTVSRKFASHGLCLALFCLSAATAAAQTDAPAIARLSITPAGAARSVAVGDSLRLTVQALDARGNVVPDVAIRFNAHGGRFQASVDSAGFVRAGSPGTVPLAVVATPRGGRPHTEKIEVRILPGPAARVTLVPAATKLLVGQQLHIEATRPHSVGRCA